MIGEANEGATEVLGGRGRAESSMDCREGHGGTIQKRGEAMSVLVQVHKRLFTVDEYHQMMQAGILSEDDRVELLNGEIMEMAPIGSRHAACVTRLATFFFRLQQRAIVWVQNPIRLGERLEPRPDLALLQPRADFYASAHPGPGDILLGVEVAETSVDYDQQVKLPLYARADIPEVWLVDLQRGRVEVYCGPSPQGYTVHRRVRRGQSLSPQSFPDLLLSVGNLVG